MQEDKLIIETRQLCKTFGPTVALDHVDMKIYRGQITGLIGENGSGKSTITSILSGMQPPTSGEMFFKGQPHHPSSMIEGAEKGIGMIVQEQGTVPGISIAENIFLGEEGKFGKVFINRAAMIREAKKALAETMLIPETDGQTDTVRAQAPAAGAKMAAGGTVMLYTYAGDPATAMDLATVPDVRGMSMVDAGRQLRARGFDMEIQGSGFAVRQEPAAGAYALLGGTVKVVFETGGD